MKTLISVLSIMLLCTINSYAQKTHSFDSTAVQESQFAPRTYLPLLIDPGLTMRSGSQNIITFHKGLALTEDKLIGTSWFSESNILGKTGGVLGRFTKYIFIDTPVDYFSIVLAHEYFGHGARYRELNFDYIDYGFDMPPPYGPGGGEASLNSSKPISKHELMAIWEGGVEIHSIINRNLSLRWMTTKEIDYREASLYFWSFQIMMSYIQDTNEDLGDGTKDNDPRAYVRIINSNAGYTDVANLKMSVKELKSKMIINAANPFVFYSMFSILKTFMWDGDKSNAVPTISFGAVNYLPGLRAGLTPFGVEYHFENYFRFNNKVSLVDISYGDQTFFDSWGGIGVFIQNIFEANNSSFDLHCNFWKQPGIKFVRIPSESKDSGFGAAFSVRGYFDFPNSDFPFLAVLELGYKSTGFLEGYDLDAAPILMVGFALRN